LRSFALANFKCLDGDVGLAAALRASSLSFSLLSSSHQSKMSHNSRIQMPERWSQLRDLATTATFETIDNILIVSLLPESAFGTFKQHVSSVDEFSSIEQEAAELIVDYLADKHPKDLASRIKQHLLLMNLLTLVDIMNAVGNTALRPTSAEMKFFIELARKQHVSFDSCLQGVRPPPDQFSPDSKMVNGAKLTIPIPHYSALQRITAHYSALQR
jgi:hypothetical protein